MGDLFVCERCTKLLVQLLYSRQNIQAQKKFCTLLLFLVSFRIRLDPAPRTNAHAIILITRDGFKV